MYFCAKTKSWFYTNTQSDFQQEHWSEAQQERLELQKARVLEVNRHLAALTDSWERGGLPLHMNLAVQHHYPHPQTHDIATRLKQQNHLLTEVIVLSKRKSISRYLKCVYDVTRFAINVNEKGTFAAETLFPKSLINYFFQEVSKKNERITMLEREKASLIREVLQMRSGHANRNGQEEAVF